MPVPPAGSGTPGGTSMGAGGGGALYPGGGGANRGCCVMGPAPQGTRG
eukprot:CAMPEP_0175950234 /NCGR_PEP_ID=MMETSP0108-20121206/29493_1 /TAXON_ID=195067 ORGANISM="Goniomonas pacifica, Strain CCMP1869" /NCGR_SAMPLE_ID=MMETSP0108 /ASSEMBLY_ACC=CAM_ASM_000204 /LENGTH=47 /DNA_ID= /DNA_START= /DNA_END= /DNA_ORIENTATION=